MFEHLQSMLSGISEGQWYQYADRPRHTAYSAAKCPEVRH